MSTNLSNLELGSIPSIRPRKSNAKVWLGSAAAVSVLTVVGFVGLNSGARANVSGAPLPSVAVSSPLQRELDTKLGFLGQFSAVEKVELRPQVGGILTQIRFNDGDTVHKGDLLFVIDSVPYEIKLSQAKAELAAAKARFDLATHELTRAETLKETDAGSAQSVEQRAADKLAAHAAVDNGMAMVRDAQFDLDHCRISAPFTGRIGNHQVSTGNLVAGSRAATSPTTLLATLISLDPIYLDFDMSESDYRTFMRDRDRQQVRPSEAVSIAPGDETNYSVEGKLDFIDNALDRSSGTIHARAIVPNGQLSLTPGAFGRVRLSIAKPQPMLLVPDASVLPDLSDHIVLTVDADNVVTPKRIEVGELRGGLRVVRSGLTPTDRVIIDGIPIARPGSKVSPHDGAIEFAAE